MEDGVTELSAPYEGVCLGIPLQFTGGRPLPCVPPLNEAEARQHLDPELRHHVASGAPGPDANPLVAMADRVWRNGQIDLDAFPAPVIDGIAQGWIRPPADNEALMTARAKVVELQETLRKRNRRDRARSAEGRPQPSAP